MQKFIFLLCLLFAGTLTSLYAQTPLENNGFENWDYDDGGDYYEPSGFWATLNSISKISADAPVTTFRETEDVYAGDYAVKLVSDIFFAFPISGTLATGKFADVIVDPVEALEVGQPFSDRPVSFSGFYKYFPVDGDSAAIVTQLTKYVNGTQELIGQAGIYIYNTTDEYTEFDIVFEYFSEETPDSISTIFTSSANGANFEAGIGSTLYIDEVALGYTPLQIPLPIMPENAIKVYPNPASNFIQVNYPQLKSTSQNEINIYNSNGQCMQSSALTNATSSVDVATLPSGLYWYQIWEEKLLVGGGKFQIK